MSNYKWDYVFVVKFSVFIDFGFEAWFVALWACVYDIKNIFLLVDRENNVWPAGILRYIVIGHAYYFCVTVFVNVLQYLIDNCVVSIYAVMWALFAIDCVVVLDVAGIA